jgi:hypothetical protein
MVCNAMIRAAGSRRQAITDTANRIERLADPDYRRFWRQVYDLLRSGKEIPAKYRAHLPGIYDPHFVHYIRINAFADGGAVNRSDDDEKITKHEARYDLATSQQRRCGLCSMFIRDDGEHGDGECTLVEGPISPYGTCRYFEKRHA